MTTAQKSIWVALLVMHCNVGTAQYDEEPDMFFVAPVTTELQRAEISSVDVYAVVNCDVLPDDKEELSSLKMEQFSSKLKEYVTDDATLKIVCRFEFQKEGERDRETRDRIKRRLVAIAEAVGFKNVRAGVIQTSGRWKDALFDASAVPEKFRDAESAVENELVVAYPIRTTLSKFEIGDFDCLVRVKQPIDGRQTEMPAELIEATKAAVNALNLQEKRSMKFALTSTTAGRDLLESHFNSRLPPKKPAIAIPQIIEEFNNRFAAYKASPALDLALDLGFESMQYSHSPRGGAPEEMVGKAAPNFRLKRSGGDEFKLHDFIKGRPAIVAFWEIGSESSRKEMPHLSRLNELYGDKLAIVGVNQSRNNRDKVAPFVKKQKITYPMLLNGRDTSRNSFKVGAYPATFWIDRNGTVVDFHLAYTSAEDLDRRARQFVEANEARNRDG